MNLLSIARVPPITVSPDDTVMHAIDVSVPARVGAVAVVQDGALTGIFTERDVMIKVVQGRRDPETTHIHEVMTTPVHSVSPTMTVPEVLNLMLERHIRHVPVSEDGQIVQGMLSIRNVLQHMAQQLSHDVQNLEAYIAGRA